MLSTIYKIFSSILLGRIAPYAQNIIGPYQTAITKAMQIEQVARDLGLHINEGKMKYMAVTSAPKPKPKEQTTSNRTGQTKTMKIGTVENFCYLGSKITTNNSYDDEIRARLSAANRAYFSLQKRLNIGSNLLLYKTMILPDLMYFSVFLAKKLQILGRVREKNPPKNF